MKPNTQAAQLNTETLIAHSDSDKGGDMWKSNARRLLREATERIATLAEQLETEHENHKNTLGALEEMKDQRDGAVNSIIAALLSVKPSTDTGISLIDNSILRRMASAARSGERGEQREAQ